MKKPVIHMIDDGRDGIEGIVNRFAFFPPPRFAGPDQDAIITVTLSWNRDQNRCGAFQINVGPMPPFEEKHFDLILNPHIYVPISPAVARVPSDWVGLRPCKDNRARDFGAKIFWGDTGQQPCYVTGAGTPYPNSAENT